MADSSKIEWTDATWNPVTGCTVLSPGCQFCYAQDLAGGRLQHHPSRAGLTKPGPNGRPIWNGKVRFNEGWLNQPLRWRRPRTIFVCAHGDLFHEDVPDEWIDKVFAVMALAPQHTFQVLTKRAERMHEFLTRPVQGGWAGRAHTVDDDGTVRDMTDARFRLFQVVPDLLPKCPPAALNRASEWQDEHYPEGDGFVRRWPLPNVWLGSSVEDRARKDRINHLRDTPAAVRFLSLEPLLEDLGALDLTGIDWVIVGGESGSNARPMHPDWVRSLRDQCQAAGVPFFFKQWGQWDWLEHQTYADAEVIANHRKARYEHHSCGRTAIKVGKKAAGRELDGRTWDEMPA